MSAPAAAAGTELAGRPESFVSQVHDPGVSIDTLGAWLDALDHDRRFAAVCALDRRGQRSLYEKAAAAAPLDVAFFAGAAPIEHHGRNSLPLPNAFRRFSKIFVGASGDRLFGFNEGMLRPYLGPGYFVAYATRGRPEWESRGSVVVDYFQVPDAAVPAGWPGVVPNSRGLQVLVYHHTRDFMRRVSAHVSIGAAYKNERSLGQFFVLCKR